MTPRASKVMPTKRTKVPLRCGCGVRKSGKVASMSAAKSII
jgi:hypothetical protein